MGQDLCDGAGVDLPDWGKAAGQPDGVVIGGQIADQGRHRIVGLQQRQGSFEEAGFSGTRARDQAHYEDTGLLKPAAQGTRRQIILLHCILSYHTLARDVNLAMIGELQRRFPDYPIGFSDHTIPDEHLTIQSAAVAAGARLVEKHYTLNKHAKGNDHWHAVEPADLKRMVANFRLVEAAIGHGGKRIPLPCELPARRLARRSVVARQAIPPGTPIKDTWLTCKRPGTGIPPRCLPMLVGRRARHAIAEDTVITWRMLDGRGAVGRKVSDDESLAA
jgi:sialic acid synthase SpsE